MKRTILARATFTALVSCALVLAPVAAHAGGSDSATPYTVNSESITATSSTSRPFELAETGVNDNAWLFAGGGLLLLVAGASLVTYRNRQKGAEWERAAYIRGRLDQAEADAGIAESNPGIEEGYGVWHAMRIAQAIRKGVE